MTNTVSTLNTTPNYPAPDMAQMAAAVRQIGTLRARADALFIRSKQYLPSWNSKAIQLHTNIADIDRGLRDAAQTMAHALKKTIDDITVLQAELKDEGHDAEDKEYFVEQIEKSVNKALGLVKTTDRDLIQQLANISENLDRQQAKGFIADDNAAIERYTADIEKLNAELKTLGEQRKVLNAGIDALKNKGFADTGNEVIGDVEKLIALGMTPPELAVVQLAIDQLKKLLQETERTITFFVMVKALDNLVDTINATIKKQTNKNDEIEVANHRIDFINTLIDMDTQRTDYLPEATKITQTTGFFLAQFPAGKDQPVESFVDHSKPLIEYMNGITFTPR